MSESTPAKKLNSGAKAFVPSVRFGFVKFCRSRLGHFADLRTSYGMIESTILYEHCLDLTLLADLI